MALLRPPGLGPIIGHTTDHSCRLWIQAQDPEDQGAIAASNRRSLGVIGLLSADGTQVTRGWYFRLQREFDRTGTFVLGIDVKLGAHPDDGIPPEEQESAEPLQPDTRYTVRMATLSLDDPLPDTESISDAELAKFLPPIDVVKDQLLMLNGEACEVTFRTFPVADTKADLGFILGSCRFPGLLFQAKQADRIFAPLQKHCSDKPADRPDGLPMARFSLMVGDQIYADTLNRHVSLGRADTYAEFQDRYKQALGSPNMRRLLRTAPSYMILDDHEIEDNWTQDQLSDIGKSHLFNIAIGAYMSYQWSHGPRSYGRRLYYRFDCVGYPFFVLDTRTHRYKDSDDDLSNNHLLGRPQIDKKHQGQLQVFLDWLLEQQTNKGNVPKFVGMSSVFAPNGMDERINKAGAVEADLFTANKSRRNNSDSWPAFPQTRKIILDYIVANNIQNVIFLSGDIHCSNIADLRFYMDGANEPTALRSYDITSSAFYWPFPFADGDPNGYVHDSRDSTYDQDDPFPIKGGVMHYESWAFTQEDNFCRIDIDATNHELNVRYYDRDGKVLDVGDRNGAPAAMNILPLAPWN